MQGNLLQDRKTETLVHQLKKSDYTVASVTLETNVQLFSWIKVKYQLFNIILIIIINAIDLDHEKRKPLNSLLCKKLKVLPDIFPIFQHRQTDGALLIGVQLFIIQTHLQVLGYSLERPFSQYSLACG